MEASCLQVKEKLEGVESRDQREDIKKEATLTCIRSIDAEIVIYTDGSAMGGTRWGGAGVVITKDDPEDLTLIETITKRGALYTCSYEEEVEAMRIATKWIKENCEPETKILICTDSQSLCMALQSLNPETDGIRHNLKDHKGEITIQWIPNHSNVLGNEMAD